MSGHKSTVNCQRRGLVLTVIAWGTGLLILGTFLEFTSPFLMDFGERSTFGFMAMNISTGPLPSSRSPTHATRPKVPRPRPRNRKYIVSWFNAPHYLKQRPDALARRFDKCDFSNCELLFDRASVAKSDAVLFQGTAVPKTWSRPRGQVWVFCEHEAPQLYTYVSRNLVTPFWSKAFNWTMTYNHDDSDIPVPYGKIVKRQKTLIKNYTDIWEKKTGGALIVTSHCPTVSKREQYIKELSKYYPVDILGKCGKKWNCGVRTLHNDCFKILNKYKFYLAFENAFCSNYFTEKSFENFKYDTLNIVRGGRDGDVAKHFPKGSVISTADFDSAKSLGNYLKHLSGSRDLYIDMLKEKDKYEAVSYAELYQSGLCEVCKRLNHQNDYRKNIDMKEQLRINRSCSPPKDL